jgi:hypothetical protein
LVLSGTTSLERPDKIDGPHVRANPFTNCSSPVASEQM